MLKLGVTSYPPTVEVKRKFFPVPEILASVNADPEVIRAYVKENIKRGVPQVEPFETQWDKVIALAVGGATLNDTFDDLRKEEEWNASCYSEWILQILCRSRTGCICYDNVR